MVPDINPFSAAGHLLGQAEMPSHIGEMLYAIGPASHLAILVFHAAPEATHIDRIHRDRNMHRLYYVVAVIVNECLKKYAGVLGDDVILPKSDVDKRTPAHAV